MARSIFHIILTLIILLILPATSFAAKKICVNQEGKLVLRKQCKASKGLSAASLGLFSQSLEGVPGPKGDKGDQGPKGDAGPQGVAGEPGLLNFEGCYSVSKSVNSSNGAAVVSVSCNSTDDFIIADRYTTGGQAAYILDKLGGGAPPSYYQYTVKHASIGGVFSFTALIDCCPK